MCARARARARARAHVRARARARARARVRARVRAFVYIHTQTHMYHITLKNMHTTAQLSAATTDCSATNHWVLNRLKLCKSGRRR